MKKKLPNIHPGEVLKEEFLKPLGISAYKLSKITGMPQTRISDIVNCKRAVTADTAVRFAKFFSTTPQFWLGLQNDYDLEELENEKKNSIESIPHYASVV